MKNEKHKIVLISGASSGLGKALTMELAQRGWQVFAGIRKPQDAKQFSTDKTGNITSILLDVTNTAHIEAVFEQLQKELKAEGLAALINNAGINYIAPFEIADAGRERELWETNVFGAVQLTRKLLPLLRAFGQKQAQEAKILNVSSIGGILGLPWESAYHASKFAVLGWSQSLRAELAPLGVQVHCFLPGGMKTSIFKKASTSDLDLPEILSPDIQTYYRQNYQGMLKTMTDFENGAAPVEQAAQKIANTLEKGNVGLRLYFGKDALFLRIASWLGLGDVLVKRFVHGGN